MGLWVLHVCQGYTWNVSKLRVTDVSSILLRRSIENPVGQVRGFKDALTLYPVNQDLRVNAWFVVLICPSEHDALLSRFVGSLSTLPLPDSSCASQHLLLFISALIPKALASLLTSFTLALAGNEQVRRRAVEDPAYLRGVLLEVQRLWPPFIGGRRIVDQVGLWLC